MKFRYAFMFFGLAGLGLVAQARIPADTIRLEKRMIERSGDVLLVDLTFDLSELKVASSRSLIYTPLIQRGDSVRVLPPLLVNGRDRQILYERTERNPIEHEEFAIRRKNGEAQSFDYHARVPYGRWMDRSELVLVEDDCGCGWESENSDRSVPYPINLVREPNPLMVYIAPMAEVKTRSLSGSAYLDFPVNQTVIRPDYRRNTTELAKIRETIESVRDDQFATITRISIKGYASPEGSYANNERLAKGRSEALLEYVKGLYDLTGVETSVDYEPEDWAGLESRVERLDLDSKEAILAVIRDASITDPDARDNALKRLNGGETYRYILNEIYPALRHSDYEVSYTIRPFSVEEAKELIYKDPKQLSLEEMFQVAQTYETGSPEFKEVFEIAVRMYPDDPVSNLNAANTALLNGNPADARRYLAKAPDTAQKRLAEGVAYWLEEDFERAKAIFESLANDPMVSEQAKANLEQLR